MSEIQDKIREVSEFAENQRAYYSTLARASVEIIRIVSRSGREPDPRLASYCDEMAGEAINYHRVVMALVKAENLSQKLQSV